MNTSGLTPLGDMVLIKVAGDKGEKTTAGGIVIPEQTAHKEMLANISARIVECGELAFEELESKPEIDSQAVIERYAGRFVNGKDGEVYRLIRDQDVMAICDGEWDVMFDVRRK